MTAPLSIERLLRWYVDAGVDETIGDTPLDRYAAPRAAVPSARSEPRREPASPRPLPAAPVLPGGNDAVALGAAARLAAAAGSLAELKHSLDAFEGCRLREAANSTVFGDGNPEARLMVVGEAPGADEDRIGIPFVGASGRLLDRMLASIGFDRESTYITNVVPWRPPGNRKPTPAEVEMCLPFIQRHIELVDPEVLLLLGGAAAGALLARNDPISQLRGRWHDYASAGLPRPVPAMATYHPAFLLRTPAQKREAWRDLLAVSKRLAG